jgi:DNA-directed RNA polymerase specialized sigma24 family protein
MSDAADLVTTASGADVRAGLQAARALRRLAETLEAAQVENARRQGWSWTEIAAVLDVSKQAVHQRYARRLPSSGSPRS